MDTLSRRTCAVWIAVAIAGLLASPCFGAVPASITLSATTLTPRIGTADSVVATLKDGSGNPVSGVTVTFSVPSGSGAFSNGTGAISGVSNASGQVSETITLTTAYDPFTMYASTFLTVAPFTVITGSASFTPLYPAQIITVPGTSGQAVPVGTSFNVLVFLVFDQFAHAFPSTLIQLDSPAAGASGLFAGTYNEVVDGTNSAGQVQVPFVANNVPGTYMISAKLVDGNHSTGSATLTNIGPPATMTPLPGTTPQSAVVGTSFQNLAVKVTDIAGYPLQNVSVKLMPPQSGPTVLFVGMQIANYVTNTDASGVATFFQASANNVVGGPYAVTAQTGGLVATFILTNLVATAAPVITQNPSSITVAPGASATFTAAATGNPTPTVRWQVNPGGGFSDIGGATSTTYSFTASASQNNYQYRAVFSNSVSTATTTAATLTVQATQTAPVITENPSSITVAPGASATFTAAATGNPTPTVQWQVNPGGGFSDIGGATSTTYSFTASASQNNYQYRAVFSNSVSTATTTAATLTVQATSSAPAITQNPSSITVAPGAAATFTAAATGNPTPTVQWQQSTDGISFSDMGGATSTTYSFTASASQNNYQYRAVFSNAISTATTTAATLTVSASTGPTIRSAQPVLPSFLGAAGFGSNMYVEIYGTGFTTTTRTWTGDDFVGILAPTQLDNVSVKINGKNAYVYFISPTQINVNTPEDTTTGPVTVQVFNNQVASNIVTVTRSRLSPTLLTTPQFNVGGKQYVVASTPDFAAFVGTPGLISGATFVKKRPGDTISIFSIGAGPTSPTTQAGVIANVNASLSLSFQLKIGGVTAQTLAVLVGGTVGLYQLNVTIPQVAAGDQSIEFIVDGISNNQNLFINVGP